MIFDQLTNAVEKQDELKSVRRIVERARLFVVARGSRPVSSPKSLDSFVLPFDTSAVEHEGSSICIVQQTSDDIRQYSPFVFAYDFNQFVIDSGIDAAAQPQWVRDGFELLDGRIGIVVGRYRMVFDDHGYKVVCGFEDDSEVLYVAKDKETIAVRLNSPDMQEIVRWYIQCVQFTLVVLSAISDTTNFVMESAPKKPREQKGGRILRSHDRPQYTILKAGEIRRHLSLPNPDSAGGDKSSHERRGHYRTYRSDRYVHQKGKRVWIEATWVGESQAVIGNRRYRVVLELRPPDGVDVSQKKD